MIKGQAGGIATARILRKKALETYYFNPKICKNCNKIIAVKEHERVSDIRKKNFCNKSCGAQYTNKFRIKSTKLVKEKKPSFLVVDSVTKKELKDRASTWQSWRTSIRKHAIRKMKGIEYKCNKCSYSLHNEICHIKPVSTFDDNATLGEINNLSNLMYLCPTHHWELDNIAR